MLGIIFMIMLVGSWVEHPVLSWGDFQGRPGRGAAAMTDTGFRTQLACRAEFLEVMGGAEFYPELSWVRPEKQSAGLLVHEQGHFDITEVFARRMKKAIREARIGCEDQAKGEAAGTKILRDLSSEWNKAERAYDAETRDGTDIARQAAASLRIARELEINRAGQ